MKTAKNKYEYIKRWKLKYPERMRAYKRKYHRKNKSRLSEYQKDWGKDNPEYKRDYERRRRINPKHRLDNNVGRAMCGCLKGIKAGRKWEGLVGYGIEDLIRHLESKFKSWMNWDNYGKWEVDHIKPKSLFNYEKPEDKEFKECWALKNLQPLEKLENRKKYNHF